MQFCLHNIASICHDKSIGFFNETVMGPLVGSSSTPYVIIIDFQILNQNTFTLFDSLHQVTEIFEKISNGKHLINSIHIMPNEKIWHQKILGITYSPIIRKMPIT